MNWADSNFYISDSVDSLSSCCFSGDQTVLWKSSTHKANLTSFEELYNLPYKGYKDNFRVFHNGSWVEGKIIRLPARGHTMYRIKTANNKEMIATDNHIFPTLSGNKLVEDITTDDYLMFNTLQLNEARESSKGYTYEQGFLVGMYLGDGSVCHSTANLSLSEYKYKNGFDKVYKAVVQIDESATLTLGKEVHNTWPVCIGSRKVIEFIREFVHGDHSYNKRLDMNCLLESPNFRQGIIDGHYLTDGGNSNRIYTTSKGLAYDIEALLTSLGVFSIIDISDRTSEPVVIRGESWTRNYPLYCIRFYSKTNKRDFVGVYKTRNNSVFFKVAEIEPVEYESEYVYCFEMKNYEDPYFTLPNGVVTHNCRLKNTIKGEDSPYFNSIGGTALNVGSVKVNTINLARLGYESKDTQEYLNKVYDATIECLKVLDVQRHIIERNIEKGLLPNYSSGLVDITKQYSTVGCVGGEEAIEHFGLTKTDELGMFSYTEDGVELYKKALAKIHEATDDFKKANNIQYMINLEQVPKGELCGDKAA